MMHVQIQLPDDIFERAKEVCDIREISIEELVRRGLEYILAVYCAPGEAAEEWQPPKPLDLGWRCLSHTKIKEQAQLTTSENQQTVRGK